MTDKVHSYGGDPVGIGHLGHELVNINIAANSIGEWTAIFAGIDYSNLGVLEKIAGLIEQSVSTVKSCSATPVDSARLSADTTTGTEAGTHDQGVSQDESSSEAA